jgi:protoporphyrinogen oxidase
MDSNDLEKKKVLILGAGPAGISAAYELNKAGKNVIVLEKELAIGGLSRTLKFGQFYTDIGPHRFFSQYQELYELIEGLLGENWIEVSRFTRFYSNNYFFNYPVDLINVLKGVGGFKGIYFLLDFLKAKFKNIAGIGKQIISFEDKMISDFGRSLFELNMSQYTEKIWGIPCSQISPDWANQRIKNLSLLDIVKKNLFKNTKGPKTLVDAFYYPDQGAGLIYEKMKERFLKKTENDLLLNSVPLEVHHEKGRIKKVVADINGKIIDISPDFLLSSIPITLFISLLRPLPPQDVLQAAKRLIFRSHVILFITLNRPAVFPDQWMYFPDKEIPFARIMEPRNFSAKLSPPGKTSLTIEFFCNYEDDIWLCSKERLFELSIGWLEENKFLDRTEVIDLFIHRQRYAYPVYDLEYSKNLEIVKDFCLKLEGVELIGRSGRFRYNNQDHALMVGLLAAQNIIAGDRIFDLDSIGKEEKYLERGHFREEKFS